MGYSGTMGKSSVSVVLPAYNEEQNLEYTVREVLNILTQWQWDFEIIIVNDGSRDRTEAIAQALEQEDPRVRCISHPVNRGYGAALKSGFAAAQKNLTFFMDSDGQFSIEDLARFFPAINSYDAVLGYRMHRQDSWVRKLNAWGWKQLIRVVLGVYVRDLDCAFKLFHTQFLHDHPLESDGAMINAELLYRFQRAGGTYTQIGVHHFPRRAGQATGANIQVILRAFRELFVSARRWRSEQQAVTYQSLASAPPPQ